jgi:hypothetical protein
MDGYDSSSRKSRLTTISFTGISPSNKTIQSTPRTIIDWQGSTSPSMTEMERAKQINYEQIGQAEDKTTKRRPSKQNSMGSHPQIRGKSPRTNYRIDHNQPQNLTVKNNERHSSMTHYSQYKNCN